MRMSVGERRRNRKGMARGTALADLDVDRVDGVDKPATGRGFLMLKSEDGPRDLGEDDDKVRALAARLLRAMPRDDGDGDGDDRKRKALRMAKALCEDDDERKTSARKLYKSMAGGQARGRPVAPGLFTDLVFGG